MEKMLKINIQQPAIATYRKPLFQELSKQFELKLFYGNDGVPMELPKKVELFYSHLRKIDFSFVQVKWHWAQIKAVNRNTDVAILSWDIQYITLWLALSKAFLLKKPVILWGHGYSKKEHGIKRIIRNIPLKLADAALLYDYCTAENFLKDPRLKRKIFVAPNSLDQKNIQCAKENWLKNKMELNEFKRSKGIDKSFNLIYIGRIYEENKLELLIDTLDHLIKRDHNVKLIIIGKENKYVEILQKNVRINGIANHIIWTGSIYEEEKIAPWMLSSHIFCYPANIGLSIMHAFGYGLPVVTDNNYVAHNPEIWSLKSGTNGLVYRKNDVCDFAEKIIELKENNLLRQEMSHAALKTVDHYNIEEMVKGFSKAIIYSAK